jgi:hypothetical protein
MYGYTSLIEELSSIVVSLLYTYVSNDVCYTRSIARIRDPGAVRGLRVRFR